MPDYALKMIISSADANALQGEIAKALDHAGIAQPGAALVGAESPPPGSFGYGEGIGGFFLDAWKQLMKVPGAVKTVAEGVKSWLSQRPNGTIVLECPDGKKLTVRANMKGEDIAKILETGCG